MISKWLTLLVLDEIDNWNVWLNRSLVGDRLTLHIESTLQEKLADLEGLEVIRDDIIVMGFEETQEQAVPNHDENLLELLERARKGNLPLNSR